MKEQLARSSVNNVFVIGKQTELFDKEVKSILMFPTSRFKEKLRKFSNPQRGLLCHEVAPKAIAKAVGCGLGEHPQLGKLFYM